MQKARDWFYLVFLGYSRKNALNKAVYIRKELHNFTCFSLCIPAVVAISTPAHVYMQVHIHTISNNTQYLTIFSVPRGKKVSLLLLEDLFHISEIILNKAIFWPVVKIMGLSTSRCRCSWSKSAGEDIQISNAMTVNYTEGCLRPQC